MKKVISFLALIFVLSACGTTSGGPDKGKNAVYPSEAETKDGDFVYRLFTEKDVYDEFGDMAIFAELTYVGDKDSIDIYHAASPFSFPIEERTRGFIVDYAMNEPLLSSTLKKDEPLREKYGFGGGYSDADDKKYIEFVKTIMNKGFPKGEYMINGSAQFYISDTEDGSDTETFNLSATIEFSVNNSRGK